MISDQFEAEQVSSEDMDYLWSVGFRHFGTYFFRYSSAPLDDKIGSIIPLRIDLDNFSLTKSQKKVKKKNKDLKVIIRDTIIDEEKEDLFFIHSDRFVQNKPSSIYDFLSFEPDIVPCANKEICLYDGDILVAASFLDIGLNSTSSVYAIFHPDYGKRSPGIYTLILEIEYSIQNKKKYLYPGYAFREESFYDYKKQFSNLEYYNWNDEWKPLKET